MEQAVAVAAVRVLAIVAILKIEIASSQKTEVLLVKVISVLYAVKHCLS